MRCGVEVDSVDDALEWRGCLLAWPEGGRQQLSHLFSPRGNKGTHSVVWVRRRQRKVEADEGLVSRDELEGLPSRTHPLRDSIDLVVEDIAKPFGEDERKDEVLVLRGVPRTSNRARGVPDPLLQRL